MKIQPEATFKCHVASLFKVKIEQFKLLQDNVKIGDKIVPPQN